MHYAARAGYTDAIMVLVDHPDCRVKANDWRGDTALSAAITAGSTEATNVLALYMHRNKDRDDYTSTLIKETSTSNVLTSF